ncbi:TetR/AcrR family transcriptional regulator C-terminal domain-containing protein [Phytoactinopolyspora limicola]|uniref:TetR/AcrR family transcriptional regulator C-terminal domain-containing protein n=1 Tax=Phytoactinopolyspora limicola TaxID=2715536 RepID=UPI00140849B8|nr:TetR/AcrR family transcriptional regulator C-terminal domain-containing protein [Phytoactinopolyspora limicola]
MPTRRAEADAPALSSVWLRPARQDRGEPPLTRERIVEAAIDILDRDGASALTMRRVAERLHVAAPSLYWHVKTKDDILDLAVDHVFAEIDTGTPTAEKPWRHRIEDLALAWRSTLIRHPWVAPVAAARPSLGPNFLDRMETLQATLHQAGFTGADLSAATWLLYNQIVGSASTESTLDISDHDRELGQQLLQDQADRYPTLAQQRYLDHEDWHADFTTGLRYLLDGLQAQLRHSAHNS